MGASKTTDNLHKKDGIYSEICTGDEAGVVGKPRLVIIHPIDINPTAVEVVKDITKTNDMVATQTIAVVTAKPPAPPLRSTDAQRCHDVHKPARPPPPKSAELRRKQQNNGSMAAAIATIATTTTNINTTTVDALDAIDSSANGGIGGGNSNKNNNNNNNDSTTTTTSNGSSHGSSNGSSDSIKCKTDNVYANLGEIRSSIAPRKPERTASMREREAQLELARKRHVGQHGQHGGDSVDTLSICSSNGENVLNEQTMGHNNNNNNNNNTNNNKNNINTTIISKTNNNNNNNNNNLIAQHHYHNHHHHHCDGGGTFERKKNDTRAIVASKLEIFECRSATPTNNDVAIGNGVATNDCIIPATTSANTIEVHCLKDSVRKINSTIDSYLKDKRDFETMCETMAVKGSGGGALVSSTSSSSPPPPPPPPRVVDISMPSRHLPPRRGTAAAALFTDAVSMASYTRSEYGPVRAYGLNSGGSLANLPRVVSTSYCGSETGEFDIYAPYSYYGSECGGDIAADINDSVWGLPSAMKNRSTKTTNRLRMRKGRSVVHKSIEDNYTAVVVANHEALAQVLDQLQQTPVMPPVLRPLANAINLRFEDFTIIDGAQAFVVGKKAFHAALWTSAPLTLALSADSNQLAGVGGELNQLSGGISGVLNPITEFCDLVPSYHLPLMPSTEVTLLQATISVLPRLQLDTLQSIGSILKGKSQLLDKSNCNFRGSIPNLNAAGGGGGGGHGGHGGKDHNGLNGGSSCLRNVVSVQNLSTLNEEDRGIVSTTTTATTVTATITTTAVAAAAATMTMTTAVAAANNSIDAETTSTNSSSTTMPAFDDVMTREVAFIMLQLVNGMKNLQMKAIEEMPLSLSNVILSKDADNKDAQARLCVLQGNNNDEDEPMGTLCKCAHIALSQMLPPTNITPILSDILLQERAESLSKSKSVLEFALWGPSDVVLSGSMKERELALQRWLDLERATVLHGLVRTRVELTVYDECHLMFLVRSNAKMMNDAAKIVCTYQQQQQQQKHQQRTLLEKD